ncbi:hypothetical protein TEA_016601 [Camellia sinensis var. sinensis]|uniref:Protein root UVB sensitive/RUS domain-containing protein n=1 Tax=Camellia sinensis var. sinensis TaxID=542762 RepID=A0A4S4E0V4_CAMSN|nr:hypothetical protein TEA_016601 [Camellia sinensis var. sinensis]
MEVRGDESTELVVEEWSGSSSTKLCRTAIITASSTSSSIAIRRSGSRFNQLWTRILQAFVPEAISFSIDSFLGISKQCDSRLSSFSNMGLITGPFHLREDHAFYPSKALLSAIGVGEKSATVIGATFQWFMRDLTGMLGGILFTFYQILETLQLVVLEAGVVALTCKQVGKLKS